MQEYDTGGKDSQRIHLRTEHSNCKPSQLSLTKHVFSEERVKNSDAEFDDTLKPYHNGIASNSCKSKAYSHLKGRKWVVASTKRFGNKVYANPNCRGYNFDCINKMNCYKNYSFHRNKVKLSPQQFWFDEGIWKKNKKIEKNVLLSGNKAIFYVFRHHVVSLAQPRLWPMHSLPLVFYKLII